MQQLIEQLAKDTGVTVNEINYIFIAFSGQLVTEIPALQQVIGDVFDIVEDATLKAHIHKLILHLQEQQFKETFGAWIMPQPNEVIHRE